MCTVKNAGCGLWWGSLLLSYWLTDFSLSFGILHFKSPWGEMLFSFILNNLSAVHAGFEIFATLHLTLALISVSFVWVIVTKAQSCSLLALLWLWGQPCLPAVPCVAPIQRESCGNGGQIHWDCKEWVASGKHNVHLKQSKLSSG